MEFLTNALFDWRKIMEIYYSSRKCRYCTKTWQIPTCAPHLELSPQQAEIRASRIAYHADHEQICDKRLKKPVVKAEKVKKKKKK